MASEVTILCYIIQFVVILIILNHLISTGMRTRADVKQEVLILSDGQSNCGGNATAEAIALHPTADVFGLMIGVTSANGQKELSSYVSEPLNEHLFAIKNFQDLKKLVDLIDQQLQTTKCAPFII